MSDNIIETARARINAIDDQLIRLLAERMDQVRAVAEHKRADTDQRLQDLAREREVFAAWVQFTATDEAKGQTGGIARAARSQAATSVLLRSLGAFVMMRPHWLW